MPGTERSSVTAGDRPWIIRVSQLVVAAFLLLRLWLGIVLPPIGDEAYYWMWGQKPALSYFDHPPLHAWLLGLMSHLFGWNQFSLRILTWVTLPATLWLFWLLARRLKPEAPGAWFWPSAAIYMTSPMFFFMGTIAFHDHLLAFLCLASAVLFLDFARRWLATGRGFPLLYAAAFFLGLSVLTKYNGVLLGFGAAAFFLFSRSLRPLWRSPHLYLAALLSIAMQAPVLLWNATEGFASYNFHLSERWGGNLFTFRPLFLLEYVGLTAVVVGPLLFPAIYGMFRRPLADAVADQARWLAVCVLAASTLLLGFLSLFIEIYFYWNIVGYVLVVPLVAGWIRRSWVLVAHFVVGGIAILVYTAHVAIWPGNDWTIASAYGWPQVAERVAVLERQHDAGFILATRYTTAAQLGFALHDTEVADIAPRHDQYDFWFDPAAHVGENAIIVTDPRLGLGDVAPWFDSLTELESMQISHYGQQIYRPTIYLGTGFHLPDGEKLQSGQ